ncbi:MAG TPA: DUF177 domain-containing protein [Acidimicrobiales bacterium]|nr:DUF177 domain-containing protein [Acidimicrobiales bacterium]
MAQNPWLVPITNLKRAPGTRRTERRSGRVGELRVAASVVPPGAEVTADAVLDAVDGGIEVTADVSAPWQGECRRCLRPVEGLLQVHVRELYRRHEDTHAHGAPHAHGHTHGPGSVRTTGHHGHHPPSGEDEDEETYPLKGELLDLQPLVRDALLLELPLAPLCSEDCQGLCATCGADLNDGPCSCEHAPADPRWAALDLLKGGGIRPEQSDPGVRRPG